MTEYSIGVDLGGTNLRAAAIGKDGELLETISGETNLISLDKLDPDLRGDLIETDNPIGRLWVQYKLETRKEILKIWRLPAGRLSRHFGHAGSAGLLARTYRVISGGRPVMVITEYFPLEPGADGDGNV